MERATRASRVDPTDCATGPLGFTLIEVMVVVLVLGMATSIALPRLRSISPGRSALQHALSRIAGAATYAGEQAALRRSVHVLRLAADRRSYSVVDLAAKVAAGHNAPEVVRGELDDQVVIDSVQRRFSVAGLSAGLNEVRFAPDGWAEPTTIELLAGNGMRGVVVIRELGMVETRIVERTGVR